MSWQRIAMGLASDKKLNGWDQMRLYALLQVAEADAYVASFDAKSEPAGRQVGVWAMPHVMGLA